MKIGSLVKLYRSSQDRAFTGGAVSGVIPYKHGLELVKSVIKSGCGRLERASVDNNDIDVDYLEDAPTAGERLYYSVKVHTKSLSTFHENTSKFISSGSEISRGICPNEYYIVDIDAYSEDTDPHYIVSCISVLCRAILLLAKIAHYHDNKSETGCLQLVFIDAGSEKSIKPILINTLISHNSIIACRDIDLSLLEQLASASPESDPHFASRQGVFYATISEFFDGSSSKDDNFEKLLSSWSFFQTHFKPI